MPTKKDSCWGDVMGEFKRGQLHSGTGKAGKKGKVVTNPAQAKAIAASTCDNTEMDQSNYMCGPDCGSSCPDCGGERKKKKSHMMALGYSEDAAETIVTEMFGPDFSEDITPMLVSRLKVIVGRCNEILQVLDHAHMSANMSGGEVEMDRWMVDKITMAADYLSAVADNSKFGGGVKVEQDYAEKKLPSTYRKGLTEGEQRTAKREIKETQAKAKSGASSKSVYENWDSDKSYNKRQKKKGEKMPESPATKAYKNKYGDTSDNSEEEFKEKKGIRAILMEKSKKSGFSYAKLKAVYDRGMAAWRSGHRPGVAPQQWALGRVNSFITGKGGARKADKDILTGKKKKK